MGPKVTIDSATLMNKGLEVIEAQWLFDIPLERIKILIHPQSIVHSMVEYRDGSMIAQMGIPDMTIPISYALSYPHHLENSLPPLDLTKVGPLTFQEPDFKKFKCLSLALEAAKIGGSMPTVLNASNEVAVEAFLKRKISFLDIPRIISNTMSSHHMEGVDTIEGILEVDAWARKKASTLVKQA
ncbi:MAG TPA: 1-deoxy-D-xylulose-5-phosphate reductoisomerase, partial [Desulfobacterales bacterium]|nr:1-deoxy-D-xylulose-5-phosphate reductoisomerase [Desulfobacterales bacterium]